jgi:hypothetical protein
MIRKEPAFEDNISLASYMIRKESQNNIENKQVIDDASS